MTMLGSLEAMYSALREGIQIDRLLFEGKLRAIGALRKNCPLTLYLQVAGQDPVFLLESMARVTK